MIIAQDNFNRTVPSGSWGSATVGGVWTLVNGDGEFSVNNSKGHMSLKATYDRQAYLESLPLTNAVVRVSFSSNSAYNGGTQNFTIIGRRLGVSTFYQARVRIESNLLRLYILKDEDALVSSTTLSYNYSPGDKIWCELSVAGTNPTTVSAKMWLDGSAEPGSYQQSATDNTSGYQVAGPVGLKGSLSSLTADAVLSFSDFSVDDPTQASLNTPVVTLTQTPPTTIGGMDGTVTATWPSVPGAGRYESCLVYGVATSGFVADDSSATSPKTYSGLAAGVYTVAVRAKVE